MATEENKTRKATGFAGLSSLVTDVKEVVTIDDPRSEVPILGKGANASHEEPKNAISNQEKDVSNPVIQKEKSPVKPDTDIATGKWMLGIGVTLSLLVVMLSGNKDKYPQHPPTQDNLTQDIESSILRSDDQLITQNLASEGQVSPNVSESAQIQTETINVLDQQISFLNPSGYCTPGESVIERELMAMSVRSVGPGARLVHAAVLCSELKDYTSGQRDTLDHWLQIHLIGPKEDFKRLDMGREAFLAGVAKLTPYVDAAEINRRLREALDNPDLNMTKINVEPLGRDGNAVYFSSRMNLNIGDSNRQVAALSAITLLNSLPLTVNVYEATGTSKSREQLQPVLQELLQSLLTEN